MFSMILCLLFSSHVCECFHHLMCDESYSAWSELLVVEYAVHISTTYKCQYFWILFLASAERQEEMMTPKQKFMLKTLVLPYCHQSRCKGHFIQKYFSY